MKFRPDYVYSVREVITLRELVESSCELYTDNIAFTYSENDIIETVTYGQFIKDIRALATYLNANGFSGKRISVTGKNSYRWALTYLAVTAGCGVIVPLDKDLPIEDAEYILRDSETTAVMISPELEEKFAGTDFCKKLYMKNIPQYISEGNKLLEEGNTTYADHKIDPNAMGILIYTSGTTGVAKGVMLSQRNICSDITSVLKYVKLYPEDRTLSVLPLHHTYECTTSFLGFIYAGASIAYNESLRKLKSDLQTFRPTVFIAVPMMLESFLKLINEKYNAIPGGKAVLAMQKAAAKTLPEGSDARRMLFKTVNQAFGGRVRLILCGAAPLSPEVFKAYESFGIKVYIGYGLTETSPISLMHSDFYRSPYDNGYPPADISVKIIDPDETGKGELAVKGKNVMLGYYKMPEETADVLQDGWFRTGDLAKLEKNGAVTIVGRLKSMIVAKNGKKIFPEELEYKLSLNNCIKECMVFATGESDSPIVTAAIFPDKDEVEKKLGIKRDDNPEAYRAAMKELITSIVEKVNAANISYKAIKKIIIRENEFQKTTTKKIKHNAPENMAEEQQ